MNSTHDAPTSASRGPTTTTALVFDHIRKAWSLVETTAAGETRTGLTSAEAIAAAKSIVQMLREAEASASGPGARP
jgi:hypothetical protein